MSGSAVRPRNVFLVVTAFFFLPACSKGQEQKSPVPEESSQPGCPYALPFKADGKFELTQGNLSTNPRWSHAPGTLNEYSFDFAMPEGTPVLAVANGTVSAIHDGETAYGLDLSYAKYANYVVLDHGGGIFSIYMHFQRTAFPSSAFVGTRVSQGQVIGYSGRTGYTSGAYHLHFQLQASGEGFAQSIKVPCFDGVEGLPQLYNLYASAGEPSTIGGEVSGVATVIPTEATENTPAQDPFETLIGVWEGEGTGSLTFNQLPPESVHFKVEISRPGSGKFVAVVQENDYTRTYYQREPSSGLDYWPDEEGWYNFVETEDPAKRTSVVYLQPINEEEMKIEVSTLAGGSTGKLHRVTSSGNLPPAGEDMIGEWDGELSAPIQFRGAFSAQIHALIHPTPNQPWLSVDVTIGNGSTATFLNNYVSDDGDGWSYCFSSLTPDGNDLEAFCFKPSTENILVFQGSGVGWSDHDIELHRVK